MTVQTIDPETSERTARVAREAAASARAARLSLAARTVEAAGVPLAAVVERSRSLIADPDAADRVLAALEQGALPRRADVHAVAAVAESLLVSGSWLLSGDASSLLVHPRNGLDEAVSQRLRAAAVLYPEHVPAQPAVDPAARREGAE